MVEWTDAERSAITDLWGRLNPDEIGPLAMARCLIVYPWTQRYFSTFGNLSSPAAIMGNSRVAGHGRTVMGGMGRAIKNMDNIKNLGKESCS
ncbi:hemoglobin subunit beta-like [Sinocyclocheilus anshuiensis]|uniref:hemoglobin subunit beta-like n=1 Tax=Sinocyclocheilus anshuiensis TaxID=1608454 RepID=UPI0007B93809|nr:PREDICTED: hemoglobin subunit beta-like [Sinocyclocheilus anshuiensis]